jgi:hypothetical protein
VCRDIEAHGRTKAGRTITSDNLNCYLLSFAFFAPCIFLKAQKSLMVTARRKRGKGVIFFALCTLWLCGEHQWSTGNW